MAEYDRAYAEAATGEPPRFAPIVERPVRTERAIRKRREAERRAAVIESLRAYIAAREIGKMGEDHEARSRHFEKQKEHTK